MPASSPKRVLMLCFYFPPVGGAGVQRSLKFVKYLPSCGWTPVVIGAEYDGEHQDHTLLAEIPSEATVHRVPFPRTPWRRCRNWLMGHRLFGLGLGRLGIWGGYFKDFPDVMREWSNQAASLAESLHLQTPFDVVFTTSHPYSSHVAGMRIKRTLGIPWVADLRDPWDGNMLLSKLPLWVKIRHRRTERKLLSQADHVIVVNEGMRQRLIDNGVTRVETCSVITNGYDPDDYACSETHIQRHDDQILLVHTGSFYGNYNPNLLFKALASDFGSTCLLNDVCMRFIGGIGDCTIPNLPSPRIEVLKRVTLPEAVAHQQAADALLITFDKRAGLDEECFPGKFFGYLASAKPIVGVVPPESSVGRMIEDCSLGIVIDPENPEDLRRKLADFCGKIRCRQLDIMRNETLLKQYSRINLCQKMADVLYGQVSVEKIVK